MATVYFRGDAPVVGQVSSSTFSGSWTSGETASVTINTKSITITAPSGGLTAAQMVAALIAAINGAAVTAEAETRNTTGDVVPEFYNITASEGATTAILVLTEATERPFTVTAADDAASGTAGSFSTVTAASGPSHFNATNCSGGSLPTTSDTLVFDGERPVLYNLDAIDTVELAAVVFTAGFQGAGVAGLPATFTNDAGTSYEYLPRYLDIDADTITIGVGEGNGSSRIMLDLQANDCTITVEKTASSTQRDRHAVQIVNSGSGSSLLVNGGSVDVARLSGESASLALARASGSAVLRLGNLAVLTAAVADGASSVECGACGTLSCYGSSRVRKRDGNVTTLKVFGGVTEIDGSGTITTTTLGQATIDLSGNTAGATFTNFTVSSAGFAINDPGARGTYSNAIAFTGVSPAQGTFQPGAGRSITVA